MEKKKITLEIEQLEERIAPTFVAPGVDTGGPGADFPPGQSTSIFNPGEGGIAGPLWFGKAASGAGPHC